MHSYPKIGTRVIVIADEYAGRQARTCESKDSGHGHIELDLLGGAFKLGVSVKLSNIERDHEREIRQLAPVPIRAGDILYSLRGPVWPCGHRLHVVRRMTNGWDVETEYGQFMLLKPRAGFENRWARMDGSPLERVQ